MGSGDVEVAEVAAMATAEGSKDVVMVSGGSGGATGDGLLSFGSMAFSYEGFFWRRLRLSGVVVGDRWLDVAISPATIPAYIIACWLLCFTKGIIRRRS